MQSTLKPEIQADILARHLKSCHCTDVQPGTLTIQGVRYVACAYVQNGQRRIYVVGERPKCVMRRAKTCFRFDNLETDWYVAAYMPRERLCLNNHEFHPLGANFLLCAWRVPSGEPIDKHNYWRGEHKPYTRVKATFEAI